MVGWPHWHVIIWGRLVVNWILEKVFSLLDRVFFIFFKVGKNLSPFWGIFIDNNTEAGNNGRNTCRCRSQQPQQPHAFDFVPFRTAL